MWTSIIGIRSKRPVQEDPRLFYQIIKFWCQSCNHYFTQHKRNVQPYERFSSKTKQLAVDTYTGDNISLSKTVNRMERNFYLEVSIPSISRWIAESKGVDDKRMEEKKKFFSGILCIDGLNSTTNGEKNNFYCFPTKSIGKQSPLSPFQHKIHFRIENFTNRLS